MQFCLAFPCWQKPKNLEEVWPRVQTLRSQNIGTTFISLDNLLWLFCSFLLSSPQPCSWALQQSMVETTSALTSHLPRKVGCQNLQCDTVAASNGCFLLFSIYQPLTRANTRTMSRGAVSCSSLKEAEDGRQSKRFTACEASWRWRAAFFPV